LPKKPGLKKKKKTPTWLVCGAFPRGARALWPIPPTHRAWQAGAGDKIYVFSLHFFRGRAGAGVHLKAVRGAR